MYSKGLGSLLLICAYYLLGELRKKGKCKSKVFLLKKLEDKKWDSFRNPEGRLPVGKGCTEGGSDCRREHSGTVSCH